MRGLILALAFAVTAVGTTAAQKPAKQDTIRTPKLSDAADKAKKAWKEHDAEALIASAPRILIQLPGADPALALGPQQAAALLSDFLAQGEEIQVRVRSAREIEPGRGYVELERKYRVAGTQDVRTQSLLLSYRLGKTGWSLVELRIVG